jgi:hypothetical protein
MITVNLRPIRFLLDRDSQVDGWGKESPKGQVKAPSPRDQSSGAEESPTALFTDLTIFEQPSRRSDEMSLTMTDQHVFPIWPPQSAHRSPQRQPVCTSFPSVFCSATIRVPRTVSNINFTTFNPPELATPLWPTSRMNHRACHGSR